MPYVQDQSSYTSVLIHDSASLFSMGVFESSGFCYTLLYPNLYPMQRLTLSFPSVFDLHDYKKEIEATHMEARVNHLTGCFTPAQLEIALNNFKAEIVEKKLELLQ